MLEGALGLLSV